MNDAWNHALLVISFYIAWTAASAYMGGTKVLWNYNSFPDEQEHK